MDKYEKAAKARENIVARLLNKYPNEVEEFLLIAAKFEKPGTFKEYTVSLGAYSDWLQVECGPNNDPFEYSGYWTRVRLFRWSANINRDIRLGGIFGEPCREKLSGCIEVEYESVKDFLMGRGWVFHYKTSSGYLMSPPGMEMKSHKREYNRKKNQRLVASLTNDELTDLSVLIEREWKVR